MSSKGVHLHGEPKPDGDTEPSSKQAFQPVQRIRGAPHIADAIVYLLSPHDRLRVANGGSPFPTRRSRSHVLQGGSMTALMPFLAGKDTNLTFLSLCHLGFEEPTPPWDTLHDRLRSVTSLTTLEVVFGRADVVLLLVQQCADTLTSVTIKWMKADDAAAASFRNSGQAALRRTRLKSFTAWEIVLLREYDYRTHQNTKFTMLSSILNGAENVEYLNLNFTGMKIAERSFPVCVNYQNLKKLLVSSELVKMLKGETREARQSLIDVLHIQSVVEEVRVTLYHEDSLNMRPEEWDELLHQWRSANRYLKDSFTVQIKAGLVLMKQDSNEERWTELKKIVSGDIEKLNRSAQKLLWTLKIEEYGENEA